MRQVPFVSTLSLPVLLMVCVLPRAASTAGIGAEFDSCGVDSAGLSPTITSVNFHAYRVPVVRSQRANRDLEFLWSDNYGSLFNRPLNAPRPGSADTDLDLLGLTICDQPGTGAFAFPIPFIRLIYDYLRAPGLGRPPSVDNYNTDPFATMGFAVGMPSGIPTYGDLDRNHIDTYVYAPKFSGDPLWQSGAEYPGDGGNPPPTTNSAFSDADEDASSGHPALLDSILQRNSFNIAGPKPSMVGVGGVNDWTHPRSIAPLVFNHEFQHAVNTPDEARARTEIFSHAAEALTGEHPEVPINDVPYTWGIFRSGFNYQAWRTLSAYLTYNFRGVDTTFAGRSDDLIWRWARSTDRSPTGLGQQLLPASCAECTTKTYFNGLSAEERLHLLLHNWRVANYVNKPALADGQYGYPPQFGFDPITDVGSWQNIDTDPGAVDSVNIELEVKLDSSHLLRELSLAVHPTSLLNPANAHTMALALFGSEYWVVRSDPSLWGANRDLVIRILPEGRCAGARLLLANAVAYSEQNLPGGQPDSLWKHPEWAQLAVAPKWIDMGAGVDHLELVVPNFGQTHKAVLIIISAGASQEASHNSGVLPYRMNLALRTAPFQSPNPTQVTTFTSPYSAGLPAWSPAGNEVAFSRAEAPAGPHQVFRAPASGGAPTALFPQAFNQYYPDWSPRGDWVSFDQATGAGGCDIWAVSPVSGQSRQLTSSADHEYAAVFSPNGQQLVYLRLASGMRTQLRRINIDGSNDTLLWERTGVAAREPRWAPDGPRVYLLLGANPPFDSLYSVDAVGPQRGLVTPIAQLAPGGVTFDPPRGNGRWVWEAEWQPLECGAPSPLSYRRLALRDSPTGTSETSYSRPGVNSTYPRWSLDGTRVAFGASRAFPLVPSNIFIGQVSYNHAPTFLIPSGDLLVHTGKPFELFASATDPDGEALTYQAPSAFLPGGASFTPATRRFSWPSPGPVCSEHFVVFRALDGSGGVASKVVKVTAVIDSVDDLYADLVSDTEVWLFWTAPGDNGALGRGVEYDLRYAQIPLSESNWAYGIPAVGMAAPGIPGALDGHVINQLTPGTPYYVAMRTKDAKGNWSLVSNLLQVTTTSGWGGGGGSSAQEIRAPQMGLRNAQTAISRAGGTDSSVAVVAVEMGWIAGAPVWSVRHLDPEETIALGAGDSTSVLFQARDERGEWFDRYRITTISAAWRFGVRVYRYPGRLVFLGPYGVRQAWNSAEIGRVDARAQLVSAQHSRLGALEGAFDGTGSASLDVSMGDTLFLSYETVADQAPAAPDWFLIVGPPGSEVSTPAFARPETPEAQEALTRLPTAVALRQNQPNPFSLTTEIRFELPVATPVRLEVFDLQGRRVATLAQGSFPAGFHAILWDRRDAAGASARPGIYLYRLEAGSFRDQKKMTILP